MAREKETFIKAFSLLFIGAYVVWIVLVLLVPL